MNSILKILYICKTKLQFDNIWLLHIRDLKFLGYINCIFMKFVVQVQVVSNNLSSYSPLEIVNMHSREKLKHV